MSDIRIFNHEMFGELPVIIIDGIEWFGAIEIATALSFSDPYKAVKNHVDKEDSTIHPVLTNGGKQNKKFVNESGLYDLVFGAAKQGNNQEIKERARGFKKWVTRDILPSIRKHGAYMTPEIIEKAMLNPDFIINLAGRLKEEQQKRIEAESTIEKQKPLVLFAETCASSKDAILIRELAKLVSDEGINIGQNRLYEKLRGWGYIIKGRTEPTQRAMDLKYFDVSQRVIQSPSGAKITRTTKVTPKGQIKIIERLKKEFSDSKSAGVYFETS